MATTFYVPVQGTWSLYDKDGKPQWWRPESEFSKFMLSKGLRILRPDDPFYWSTDVNGTKFWNRWFGDSTKDHGDWIAGGAALRYYLDRPCIKCGWHQEQVRHRNLIAHSHGLQVVLYACAQGLRVRRLISVGSPIRADMFEGENSVAKKALKNIDGWLHIHDNTLTDRMQIFGEFGDGEFFGQSREVPFGTVVNDGLDKIGHSQILWTPEKIKLWEDRGWIDFLKN